MSSRCTLLTSDVRGEWRRRVLLAAFDNGRERRCLAAVSRLRRFTLSPSPSSSSSPSSCVPLMCCEKVSRSSGLCCVARRVRRIAIAAAERLARVRRLTATAPSTFASWLSTSISSSSSSLPLNSASELLAARFLRAARPDALPGRGDDADADADAEDERRAVAAAAATAARSLSAEAAPCAASTSVLRRAVRGGNNLERSVRLLGPAATSADSSMNAVRNDTSSASPPTACCEVTRCSFEFQ